MATHPTLRPVWLAYLLVLLLLAVVQGADEVAPSEKLLAVKNFKLIARVGTGNKDGRNVLRVVEELYSNDQKRARLTVARAGGATDATDAGPSMMVYYYEGPWGSLVEHNPNPEAQVKCKNVRLQQTIDGLLGFKMEIARDWTQDGQIPNHLVGLARLAFWVDQNRQHLEPAGSGYPDTRLRNILVRAFTLKCSLGCLFSCEEVVAYYPVTPTKRDWSGFPLALDVRDNGGATVRIEFMNVVPLRQDLEEMNSRQPLDQFAIPVGIDCSKQLKPSEWTFSRDAILSFRMEMLDYSGARSQPAKVSEQFIAFHGPSDLLRVDSYNHFKYSIGITDVSSLCQYNIYHHSLANEIEQDVRGNNKAGNMFERDFVQTNCIKSTLKLASDNSFKPFFPFMKMIPMGRAHIRGVECTAFEVISSELPVSLFHPITYVKQDGTSESVYNIGVDETRKGEVNYNFVYYFAADPPMMRSVIAAYRSQTRTVGNLMRIDVYLNGELRYHMDISEFIHGKLVDAPNGDPASELFSLRDRCTRGQYGALDYATLNAELRLKINPKWSNATAPEVGEWLSRSSLRTQVALQTLVKPAPSLMTSAYDVQTQLGHTDHLDELRIYLEAKLTYPDVRTSWPQLVGYAISKSGKSFQSNSLDCFVHALAQKSTDSDEATVIMNCPNRCWVFPPTGRPNILLSGEGNKIVDYSRDLFESVSEIKPSDDYCPLLVIKSSPEPSISERHLLHKSNCIHEILQSSQMYMDFSGMSEDKIRAIKISVPTTIAHIDIKNDHWLASVGNLAGDAQLSAVERDTVDGVGLTQTSGQRYSSSDEAASPMDLNLCHSVCSSRPECRSFSICLLREGVECIISEVDFRNASLLQAIETKRAELKSATERRTVVVQYGSSVEQVELRMDLHCKIHKRNALEMFHKIGSTGLNLRKSTVISVDSLEKCAELCWRNNLQFFSTMDRVASDIGQGASEEALSKMKAEWESNKVNWCYRFFYLNLAFSSDFEWAKSLFEEKKLEAKAGLCVPNTDLTSVEYLFDHQLPTGKDVRQQSARFDSFEFSYSTLYAAQYGKRITETKTARQIRYMTDNFENCAKACFWQVEGVCKSYDSIETSSLSDPKVSRYCVLHMTTLEEMEKSGLGALIEDLTKLDGANSTQYDSVRAWHYEPKLHAMAGAMLAKKALVKLHQTGFQAHGFGILLAMLASIACTALIVKLRGDALVELLVGPPKRSVSIQSIVTGSNGLDHPEL